MFGSSSLDASLLGRVFEGPAEFHMAFLRRVSESLISRVQLRGNQSQLPISKPTSTEAAEFTAEVSELVAGGPQFDHS